VYRGLECYNNIYLSRRGKDQGWARHAKNLVPGNVDIWILGCWSGRNGDWVLQ
jgi:hypothetical protein